MINELLKQLGLAEKQARVYLGVLQYGKITPASLAKIVGLNRSTVYSVAKELMALGVIAEDLGGRTLYLVAKPAEDLEMIVKRQEKELEGKKNLVKSAISELKGLNKTGVYAVPKIVFIEESEIDNHLYKQTPIWAESIRQRGGTWWGFQDHSFVEHYEKWIDWSWESGVQEGIDLKLLSNEQEGRVKRKTFPRRTVKFWNQSKHFTASTWICGDYVIMLVTNQRPHYLVEIHDAVLALNQREVFKGLWQSEIEPNKKHPL